MFNKTKNSKNVQAMISRQIQDVKDCLISFESFIRAACTPATVFETLDALAAGVAMKEDIADRSLRSMIDSLAGGSYLPSTREDLISIAAKCDGVANKCESTANMLVFRRFVIPAEYSEKLVEMMSITRDQFDLLENSILMLFTRFDELLKDHSILDEIRSHETSVDKIEQDLTRRIFSLDMGLAERNQLAKFVENIADISDAIENIADKIQIMLITRRA